MKLLYLHQFDLAFAGGSGVFLRNVVAELGELGHTVDVVSAPQMPIPYTLAFGPEKRANERTLDELATTEIDELATRTAHMLASARPDLVLANHISVMAQVAWHLHRSTRTPYRIISHGSDTDLLVRNGRYRDMFAEAVREAERVFAISRFVADQVTATTPARGVEVLGGAVDPRKFHLPAESTGTAITYVGRMVTEKGLWTLLDAHARLAIDARLDLVGEGPLLPDLERHIASSPHRSRIHVLGFCPQDRLRDVLLRSAVLVVPSTWQEPLGLVVLEAMACGVPVIVTDVGGLRAMVRDGVDGHVVAPGDSAALARALDRLLGDPAHHARLRAAVRNTPIPTYRDLSRAILR